MQIKFFFESSTLKIEDKKKLKQFIAAIFEQERVLLSSLTYIFCSDEYLLSINRQFLQHDDYTDVITFTLSEPEEPIQGEIYISADRIKENAAKFGTEVNMELYRVIFHGALHLCGYKDKSPKDKKNMTKAEDKYLKLYN